MIKHTIAALLFAACTSQSPAPTDNLNPPTHAYEFDQPDGTTVTLYGATYAEDCAYLAQLQCGGTSDTACVSGRTLACCGDTGSCPEGTAVAPSLESWDSIWETCAASLPAGGFDCDEVKP